MEGNKNLTLALVWQMMRAYTLSLLSQVYFHYIWIVAIISAQKGRVGGVNISLKILIGKAYLTPFFTSWFHSPLVNLCARHWKMIYPPFFYILYPCQSTLLHTKSIIINNFNIQIKGNVVNFCQWLKKITQPNFGDTHRRINIELYSQLN